MARNEVARDESRRSEALAAGADPRFRTAKAWGARQKEGFLDFVPTNTVRTSLGTTVAGFRRGKRMDGTVSTTRARLNLKALLN